MPWKVPVNGNSSDFGVYSREISCDRIDDPRRCYGKDEQCTVAKQRLKWDIPCEQEPQRERTRQTLQSARDGLRLLVRLPHDSADVREGLVELLASVGLKSEGFSSTAEFLRRNVQDVASCLVLDVRLPGLSGLDFQAELTKGEIAIPIIFITGHGDIPMTVRA